MARSSRCDHMNGLVGGSIMHETVTVADQNRDPCPRCLWTTGLEGLREPQQVPVQAATNAGPPRNYCRVTDNGRERPEGGIRHAPCTTRMSRSYTSGALPDPAWGRASYGR